MLKVDLPEMIIQMVELALERGEREYALIVPIQLSVNVKHRLDAAFFFYRGSSYTTMGMKRASDDSPDYRWKLVVHHDSAWREDGVRGTLNALHREFESQAVGEGAKQEDMRFIEARFYPPPRKRRVADLSLCGNNIIVEYE